MDLLRTYKLIQVQHLLVPLEFWRQRIPLTYLLTLIATVSCKLVHHEFGSLQQKSTVSLLRDPFSVRVSTTSSHFS